MHARQQQHIRSVIHVAAEGRPLPPQLAALHDPDALIRASWARCVHEHRLDPARMQEPVILPAHRVREHRERLDDFLRIARHGLEALYQQVAGMGYCVLLTDARGVTVDFIGDLQLDASLRKAGLYLGADWSEQHAGTCGVGTAIATGQALVVHQDDHFDATHIPLTCTAAPVYDPLGRLNAVLDISALVSPQAKSSQHLALQLVKVYASRVENANFLRWFRNDWVVKLHPSPEFVEISPDHLIALDAAGRIVGHNRAAQQMLEAEAGTTVLGLPFDRFFNVRFDDLGRFVRSVSGDRRGVTLRASGRVLFLHAVPPPARVATSPAGAAEPAIPSSLARLSGGDPRLDRQIDRAARLADTPVGILLTGETGSGKEFFARALHDASQRRAKPFVAVNCAAIPETLIESELFGHLPGSFSGAATKGKRGLIQEADGGTLFLDEIGDMPLALQSRLLRVLAEREVQPVGATRPVPVDIRVVAATHADLEALVREGRFRDDLYYRLAGAHLTLPPLRERRDLPWLIQRLVREGTPVVQLSADAEALLRAWHWPGNVRELRNAIDFARAVCRGGVIEVHDLPDRLLGAVRGEPGPHSPAALPAEAQLLLQYLRAARWNVSAVAHQMGLSRMTVYRRMKRWGIGAPRGGG
ncbi:MAG: sigma-54-dependent Fis family transcriptional regulator [Rubrivivax sp.]|jgi:transcriptional regulator of acetoin/glycerol metabolism|nr:sigma-54-dependent Fis family transcriptional regulator [Rubrivivax sp.]